VLVSAGAIWKIEKDRTMIAVLTEKIKQRSLYRIEASQFLGEIGPDAKEAIPTLKAILDGTTSDRSALLKAIQRIDPKALPF
jgi:hypothetical protein